MEKNVALALVLGGPHPRPTPLVPYGAVKKGLRVREYNSGCGGHAMNKHCAVATIAFVTLIYVPMWLCTSLTDKETGRCKIGAVLILLGLECMLSPGPPPPAPASWCDPTRS